MTHMRIRVSDELRAKLIGLAEKNSRSLNTEVVQRLEASLNEDHQTFEIGRMVQFHDLRIEHLEDQWRRLDKESGRLVEVYHSSYKTLLNRHEVLLARVEELESSANNTKHSTDNEEGF